MTQITLGNIALPADLHWVDEFDWMAIEQSEDYTLTGALVVQTGTRHAGRPITLSGDWAWVTRSTVKALQALADTGQSMLLTLADSRSFTTRFRSGGIQAQPVVFFSDGGDSDFYTVELKLLMV